MRGQLARDSATLANARVDLERYQALLAHPLGPRAGEARAVLDDMLESNRAFLPQFFGEGAGR